MRKYRLHTSVSSNIGLRKKKNEDNFYLNGYMLSNTKLKQATKTALFDGGVFAIADGMGGLNKGEFASFTAIAELHKFLKKKKLNNIESMTEYVKIVNDTICHKIDETKEKMGTTIAIVSIYDKDVHVYNIGDTRCYLYRDGKLTQISKDHTVYAKLVEMNVLTNDQNTPDKRKHELYQHIGIKEEDVILSPFEGPVFEIEKNDIILLVSDGVTDVLSDDEIISILDETSEFEQISNQLVHKALAKKSQDNITSLVIKYAPEKGKDSAASWVIGIIASAILGIIAGLLLL